MSENKKIATLNNGRSIELDAVPALDIAEFQRTILSCVDDGQRVAAMFASPASKAGATFIYAILADDEQNYLNVTSSLIECEEFPSLTPRCPQVHMFEREIAEQFGLIPAGHPELKAVRYHKAFDAQAAGRQIRPGVSNVYRVEGEEVHEVAVGPVHAGVIEPGHFRFQCHGEQVYHLEIALGYQHRGIEQAMVGGPTARSIHYAQTIAGDTTVAHAMSYCQIVETLANCQKSPRVQSLRGIALELERLANHIGDLGAIANDVGYLPTASYCGRIRGDLLNMTALICGSRFGRGMIQPGGVGYDIDQARIDELLRRLDAADKDMAVAVNLLWNTPTVMTRLEEIGKLPADVAIELGIVGVAARACGLEQDARQNQPSGIFRFAHIPISTCESGDVFARAYVRWLEIQHSVEFIREQLRAMPAGAIQFAIGQLSPRRLAVELNEGWRGEVCHVAVTDESGKFGRYKIVDPSFHNWSGLAYALRNQQISDFPLCNKSFNLSYCGHDL